MKLLDYDGDLSEAKCVEDLTYMKVLRTQLVPLGGWPQKNVSKRAKNWNAWHMATMNIYCYFTQFTYVFHNIDKQSTLEMGHSFITMFMTTVFTSRIILAFSNKYHDTALYFAESAHIFNHKNKSPYAKETNKLVHKISHAYTLYLVPVTILGNILFNLIPLYTNYSNGMFGAGRADNSTFDHSLYHVMPFDHTTKLGGYVVGAAFNYYATYFASSSFSTYDAYLSMMVFHIWGHIRILNNILDTFPKPASKKGSATKSNSLTPNLTYTDEELKDVFAKLREAIEYHNFILDFASKMQSAFGEILLFYYAFHQVCGCFLLLVLSQMEAQALIRYGTMSFILFQQLIQISIIFELLDTSGEKLVVAVYGLPWEYMDFKNRRLVYFMLRRAQVPMSMKALDMVTIGVQTMLTILRTSFSYFVMLRTFAEE